MRSLGNFLAYGAIGLSLALAVLAYLLLRREQSVARPRSQILKTLSVFMGFALVLALAGFVGEFLKSDAASMGSVRAELDAKTKRLAKVDEDLRSSRLLMQSLMGLKGGKVERLKHLDPRAREYAVLVQEIQADLEKIDRSAQRAALADRGRHARRSLTMAMMPEVFFDTNGNVRATGRVRREANGQPQSLNASISDGDTIGVHIEGSGSVRFLGIDTPEKNFQLPGSSAQRRLDSPEWEAYLTDPFQAGTFGLDTDLVNHLRTRLGPGAGVNHRSHAANAEQALIALVQADANALGQPLNTFGYFLSFSFEVFDSFGRFLAFINRNQPSANTPGPRPLSYNERMLERGAALPYFIWPNIDPFRDSSSLLDAVIAPGTANQLAQTTPTLRRARDFVGQARASGSANTVFATANPLRFEAFEVRYLARREAPNRAVIDLSRNDNFILQPQHYFRIPHAEDRLFIPPAFVPLFVSRGWRLEGWF